MHQTPEDIASSIYPCLLTFAPSSIGDNVGFRSGLPEKSSLIHLKDLENVGGATKSCHGSVETGFLKNPEHSSSATYGGPRIGFPEETIVVHADGGEDSPASTSSNPVFSSTKTVDSCDSSDSIHEDEGLATAINTSFRSEVDGEFSMATPKPSTDRSSFRTEVPEKNTFVHFDDVDDDGGAMIPTNTCPGSLESNVFQICKPISNAADSGSGFRTELLEQKAPISWADLEDSPYSASAPMAFSWARTIDPFHSIDNVEGVDGPTTPRKTCLRSVEKKDIQIAPPKSSTVSSENELRRKGKIAHCDDEDDVGRAMSSRKTTAGSTDNEWCKIELPEQKTSINWADVQDSPVVTSPTPFFSWVRTMDDFERIDNVSEGSGFAQKEDFLTNRNRQNEALHLRGECQPCAFFALRADGCRRGNLCEFCHLCDKKEIKRRKRQYRKHCK